MNQVDRFDRERAKIIHMDRFPEEALALAEIRDRKLWKHDHESFEAFLKTLPRPITADYAGRMIRAARRIEQYQGIPWRNESVVRPLMNLDNLKFREVMGVISDLYRRYNVRLTNTVVRRIVKWSNGPQTDIDDLYDRLKLNSKERVKRITLDAEFVGANRDQGRYAFKGAIPNLPIGTKVRLRIYVPDEG